MNATILIVDDDPSIRASLSFLVKQAGYQSRLASSVGQAMEELNNDAISLVLQDMNFSRQTTGEEGLSLLRRIKTLRPNLPVILITAWGSISLAVQGVKAGASDFITKPWTNEQLLHVIGTTLGLAAVSATDSVSVPSREDLDQQYDFRNIIGGNVRLTQILQIAGRVAPTDASVLITGESGTGKELIAEAIHRNSRRKEKPFVKVNLGGISSSLFESEMFGHVKGAFTDAVQDRKGRFEMVHGGTILLDEIGDLPLTSQVKLLRVLQDRTFEVLGSSTTRTVDVRVISATNSDLSQMVEGGTFREDLLYRLNLIAIHLPALRDRRDDIPRLAHHFLLNIANVYRRSGLSISVEAVRWLQQQSWPGNVRQLRHVIERAVLMASNNVLTVNDFHLPLAMDGNDSTGSGPGNPAGVTLEEMERTMIVKCLQQFGGNVSKTAEALGLSRAALYRRLEKFGISS